VIEVFDHKGLEMLLYNNMQKYNFTLFSVYL
jgi:hypothetical protein